jgi:hypothetical protein
LRRAVSEGRDEVRLLGPAGGEFGSRDRVTVEVFIDREHGESRDEDRDAEPRQRIRAS